MCRSIGQCLALFAVWAGPLAAQDSAAVLRGMEHRLDSMRAMGAERDSAAQRASTTDTVTVGGLRIATSPQLRPMAQRAAEEAWSLLLFRFGPSIELDADIPVIQFGSASSVVPERADLRGLARGFFATASQSIWRSQGAVVLAWMEGNVPTEEISTADLAEIAEELVRTPARPDRSCGRGDVRSCAEALGIGIGSEPLGAWYAPQVWPRLAAMVGGQFSGAETVDRERCMDQHDLQACQRFLLPARVLLPIGVVGRQYLVQLALNGGGDSAFGRLTAGSDTPIDTRLAAAAGMPADSLLARWSAAVRAAAPRGPGRPRYEFLLALGWSMLLFAATTRSPRWR